ncbi:uncharacterized protein C2845_PM03G16100 [Panicum miliaceum]|uniref:Dirigent protein n=1 Tax=Panicum miliaceum TaxID=4540 RepID=A0A3L6TEW7_PANMI|nr:uncharacterized protein C2845_PM03G16100 [Panicum miliaceum]
MATKILLPVTLCLLLLVLAAQGKQDTDLVIYGTARCKSNYSRIIGNARLHLMIGNATIPGTGMTTNTGQIMMAVSLTSSKLVASLMSNGSSKALLVAPPHACGAPSIPPGTVVGAPVRPTAVISASDGLLRPIINGSLHATNVHQGDGDAVREQIQYLLASVGCLSCVTITW